MPSHLFLATIGPVQEFIASARRSRDLWFGSWLLSQLARTAAQTVADMVKGTDGQLIFPITATLADPERDVVNRIVAELPPTLNPVDLGRKIDENITSRLTSLGDQALGPIEDWPEGSAEHRIRATQQIADLIELYWVAVPRSGNDVNDRAAAEALLAARKATRDFAAVQWGAPVPKSSIDGTRESVIPEYLFLTRRDTDPADQQRKIDNLYRYFRAKQSERLSGVDLLKRRGHRDTDPPHAESLSGQEPVEDLADFPSTSHFAALPFLSRIASPPSERIEAFAAELRTLGARPERLAPRYQRLNAFGPYDASLLFESRLAEEVKETKLPTAQAALRRLLHDIAASAAPEPYYALLLADGDNMGKVIDNQRSFADQQQLSHALDGFAGLVRSIVETDHRGALVYAGGDDVLAFLPLDTVLRCAFALHDQYDAQMHGFVAKNACPSTLSVGIAICHQIEPLSDALQMVRKAEKAAKAIPDKDALAIILSKRSGADQTICGSWASDFFTRLEVFIRLHRSDAIPDGAAYELREMDERLRQGERRPTAALLVAEAERILSRKRGLHGTAVTRNDELVPFIKRLPMNDDEVKAQQWSLQQLAESVPMPNVRTEKGRQVATSTVRQFADELIVTREFACALGPLPE